MSQPQTCPVHGENCPTDVARRKRGRRRRILGYTLLAILIVPPVFDVLSDPFGEVADWYRAAALENYEAGNRAQAEANLKRAESWSPNSPQIHVARAAWAERENRYEDALAELDKAIELGGKKIPLLIRRTQVLQHLKRYDEAVADWEEILEQTQKRSLLDRLDNTAYQKRISDTLNALAYAQSLGKVDLPKALERISASLEFRSDPNLLSTRQDVAMKLDTRGYIHYLLGNNEAALTDLNQAIEQMEFVLRKYRENIDDVRRQTVSASAVDEFIENLNRGLAVMLYHRGLVYEALGNHDRAQADLDRVRQITGREPGDWLF
jgi:tetratricopeptide (TPR) repeat protein